MAKKVASNNLSNILSFNFLKERKTPDDMYLKLFTDINSNFYSIPQASWIVGTFDKTETQPFFNRLSVVDLPIDELESTMSDKEIESQDYAKAINLLAGKKINNYIRINGTNRELGAGCRGVRKFICCMKVDDVFKVLYYFPSTGKRQTEEEIEAVSDFLNCYLYDVTNRKEEIKFNSYNEMWKCKDNAMLISSHIVKAYMDVYTSVFAFSNNAVVFGNLENDNIVSYNKNEKKNIDRISMFKCYMKGNTLIGHISNNEMKYRNDESSILFSFNVSQIALYNQKVKFEDFILIDKKEVHPILIFKEEATFESKLGDEKDVYDTLKFLKGDARNLDNASCRLGLFKRKSKAKVTRDENGDVLKVDDMSTEYTQSSPHYNYSGARFAAMHVISHYIKNGPLKETLSGYVEINRFNDSSFNKYKEKDLKVGLKNQDMDVKKVYIAYSKMQAALFSEAAKNLESMKSGGFSAMNKALEAIMKGLNIKFDFELRQIDDVKSDVSRVADVEKLFSDAYRNDAYVLFSHLYDSASVKENFGGFAIPNDYIKKVYDLSHESPNDKEKAKENIALTFDQIVIMRNFAQYHLKLTEDDANELMKDFLSECDLYTFMKGANQFNFFGSGHNVVMQGFSAHSKKSDKNFDLELEKSFLELAIKDNLLAKRNVPFEEDKEGIDKINFIILKSKKLDDIYSKLSSWDKSLDADYLGLFKNKKNGNNYLEDKKGMKFVSTQDIELSFDNSQNLIIKNNDKAFCPIKSGRIQSEENIAERGFDGVCSTARKINQNAPINSYGILLKIKGEDFLIQEIDARGICLGAPKAENFFHSLSEYNNDFHKHVSDVYDLIFENIEKSNKEKEKGEILEKNFFGDIFTDNAKKKGGKITPDQIPKDKEKTTEEEKSPVLSIPRPKAIWGAIDGSGILMNERFKMFGCKTLQIILGNANGQSLNKECDFKQIHTFVANKLIGNEYHIVDMPEEAKRFLLGLISKDLILTKRFSIQSLFQKYARLELGE